MVTTSMSLWATGVSMVTLCTLTADTGWYFSPSHPHVYAFVTYYKMLFMQWEKYKISNQQFWKSKQWWCGIQVEKRIAFNISNIFKYFNIWNISIFRLFQLFNISNISIFSKQKICWLIQDLGLTVGLHLVTLSLYSAWILRNFIFTNSV